MGYTKEKKALDSQGFVMSNSKVVAAAGRSKGGPQKGGATSASKAVAGGSGQASRRALCGRPKASKVKHAAGDQSTVGQRAQCGRPKSNNAGVTRPDSKRSGSQSGRPTSKAARQIVDGRQLRAAEGHRVSTPKLPIKKAVGLELNLLETATV